MNLKGSFILELWLKSLCHIPQSMDLRCEIMVALRARLQLLHQVALSCTWSTPVAQTPSSLNQNQFRTEDLQHRMPQAGALTYSSSVFEGLTKSRYMDKPVLGHDRNARSKHVMGNRSIWAHHRHIIVIVCLYGALSLDLKIEMMFVYLHLQCLSPYQSLQSLVSYISVFCS